MPSIKPSRAPAESLEADLEKSRRLREEAEETARQLRETLQKAAQLIQSKPK
jgi:exonuclease VII small subunit